MQTSANTTDQPTERKCIRCEEPIELGRMCRGCVSELNKGYATVPKFYRENQHLPIAKDESSRVTAEKPFLTFLGAAGTGKSLSAARTSKALCQRDWYAMYWQNCAELLLEIRATFKDGCRDTEAEVVKRIVSKPLLVLDDLAAEKVSDYSVSTLYIIINSRGERALPTIITSNLSLRQIAEQLGSRIADRLQRYGDVVYATDAAHGVRLVPEPMA
jgi:DNA replication protein DnaC